MATTPVAKAVNMAVLAAGTKFFASYDYGVTFEKVPGMTAIGDVGEMADTQETTTLEDTSRTYIGALATPANKQFVGNYLPSDPAQAKFVQAAKDRKTIIIKIVMPTRPKTIGVNTVVLLGFQLNGPTAENVIQFTVGGQASGKTIWSTDTDVDIQSINLSALTNTVAVGGTLQLQAETLPADATVAAGQLVYEAVNPEIATISTTGAVTGVKAGEWSARVTDSLTGISSLFFGRVVAAAQDMTVTAASPDAAFLVANVLTFPGSTADGKAVTLATVPADAVGTLANGSAALTWDNATRKLTLVDASASLANNVTLTFKKAGYNDKVISVKFTKA